MGSHTTHPSAELHRSPQHETEQGGGALTLSLPTEFSARSLPPQRNVPSLVQGSLLRPNPCCQEGCDSNLWFFGDIFPLASCAHWSPVRDPPLPFSAVPPTSGALQCCDTLNPTGFNGSVAKPHSNPSNALTAGA